LEEVQSPKSTTRRYFNYLNVDPTSQINFKALSASGFDNGRRIANKAFAVFEQAAPEIGAEIRSLITEIVFVSGAPNESLRFDRATSFFCWGTLFLNADAYRGPVKMIDGLTHESGTPTFSLLEKSQLHRCCYTSRQRSCGNEFALLRLSLGLLEHCRASDSAADHQARTRKGVEHIAFKK